MSRPVDLASITARAAGSFAALGQLDAATAMLEAAGWDGRIDLDQDPAGLGGSYERSVDPRMRRARGMHFTPLPVARGLSQACLGPLLDERDAASVRVGDPSCGAGAFLVAAAEVLCAAGAPVDRIIGDQLFGADVDPVAVALARIEVALWSVRVTGRVAVVPDEHLVVADALNTDVGGLWGERVDAVTGNPPFGAQLKGATVRDRADQERLASTLGIGALGYADTSALFLLRSVDLVRPAGRVALILPTSVAAARSARTVRAALAGSARITDLWIADGDVGFDAAVAVWAPILQTGSPMPGHVRVARSHGASVEPLDTVEVTLGPSSWAPLLRHGRHIDLGRRSATPEESIASVASLSAGFRRHFYGLIPFVRDDPSAQLDGPMLVTTGAIDPFHHRTDRTVRFAGRSFARPIVDLDAADDGAIADWVRSLMVPKVLIASQGRVLEVIVDADGSLIGSTPVIALVPKVDIDVWHLAAVVSSPLASLRLHLEAGGTGMDGRGCRVTTGFVGGLGLPGDRAAWDEAADAARRATSASARADETTWSEQLDRLGAAALGRSDAGEVLSWWNQQRPPWRGARLLRR